jgi:1-acyl-sn-glycerol-3-phosphate acyltransferase
MSNLFIGIYTFFQKHRMAFIAVIVIVVGTSAYLSSKIKLEEDISKVIPHEPKIDQLNQILQQSGFSDKLVFNVSLRDTNLSTEELITFSDSLVASLELNAKEHIKEITSKIDNDKMFTVYELLYSNLPLFLTEKDYTKIDTLLKPSFIDAALDNNYKTMLSPASMVLKKQLTKDPLGIGVNVLNRLSSLQLDDHFELQDGHIVSKNGRNLLFFVVPSSKSNETKQNALLIKEIDQSIIALSDKYHNKIKAEYFGRTAVAVANAERIKKDIILTVSIAITLLFSFITWHFRTPKVLFLLFLPVLFGGLMATSFLFLLKGTVSAISIGLGAVLLGLTVDYSLHALSHFREGNTVKETLHEMSSPLLISVIITALDFLCLQFVESEALKDLGIFAATSVIAAALATLVVVPHLLKHTKKEKPLKPNIIDKIAAHDFHKNKIIITALLGLVLAAAFLMNNVGFEGDMMKMNYMPDNLAVAEINLNHVSNVSQKSVYVVASGTTLEAALQNAEANANSLDSLKASGAVKQYLSTNNFLPSIALQKRRIALWNAYWTPEKKSVLKSTLLEKGLKHGFKAMAFAPFFTLLEKSYNPFSGESFSKLRQVFPKEFLIESPKYSAVIMQVKADAVGKPLIYKAFENKKDIVVIDRQYITECFVSVLKNDFNLLANISFLLVFAIMLVTYGRIELALITFTPLIFAWILILGIMVSFGIKFNILNIMISTFVCGLGIDYSIFITSGLREEYQFGHKQLITFKKSIILSAVTTIIGIGVMVVAKHPALRSIATLCIVGMLSVVIIAFTIQPIMYRKLILNRTQKGLMPLSFSVILLSAFAFLYFLLGCILLNILAPFIMWLMPFKRVKRKLILNSIMMIFARSLVYIMLNVKKTIINPDREDFTKPALIIVNHQSFLDILLTVMLYPKIILFTNDWVYNSPFFGFVVRMAGYYPVSKGGEESLDYVRSMIKQGYSVVIFPEGTRSNDEKIGRFHKGAFYLAQELSIDILPILLHGTGRTMTKGDDFVLKNGNLSIKFLPRIMPDNMAFGIDYAERTKKISKYFKDEYQKLKLEVETPNYFKQNLITNYLYKGPVLEWYMRIKISLEKHYTLQNNLLPKKGKIVDIGCGYGFMSYMLHFCSKDREVIGLDYDKTKIDTANNCYSKNNKITFVETNIIQYELPQADAFVLNDVLHYFPEKEQLAVIEHCIEKLNDNGIIIIRDGNKEDNKKHKGTRLSEYFSTKVIKFNKTEHALTFLSRTDVEKLAAKHALAVEIIDNTRLTSNLVYVLKRNHKA